MTISLTIPQAAAESGLSETTIRAAIRDGRLPARVADGGRLIILASDLAAYVARLPKLEAPSASSIAAQARSDSAAKARGRQIAAKALGRKLK